MWCEKHGPLPNPVCGSSILQDGWSWRENIKRIQTLIGKVLKDLSWRDVVTGLVWREGSKLTPVGCLLGVGIALWSWFWMTSSHEVGMNKMYIYHIYISYVYIYIIHIYIYIIYIYVYHIYLYRYTQSYPDLTGRTIASPLTQQGTQSQRFHCQWHAPRCRYTDTWGHWRWARCQTWLGKPRTKIHGGVIILT